MVCWVLKRLMATTFEHDRDPVLEMIQARRSATTAPADHGFQLHAAPAIAASPRRGTG